MPSDRILRLVELLDDADAVHDDVRTRPRHGGDDGVEIGRADALEDAGRLGRELADTPVAASRTVAYVSWLRASV